MYTHHPWGGSSHENPALPPGLSAKILDVAVSVAGFGLAAWGLQTYATLAGEEPHVEANADLASCASVMDQNEVTYIRKNKLPIGCDTFSDALNLDMIFGKDFVELPPRAIFIARNRAGYDYDREARAETLKDGSERLAAGVIIIVGSWVNRRARRLPAGGIGLMTEEDMVRDLRKSLNNWDEQL